MKKALCILILILLTLTGCGKKEEEPVNDVPSVEGLATIHEEEFGGVYLKMTIEDFNALGFKYGDSVDVVFSNGYTLEDIPYYNGYYVDAGEPLLIAYPGYDYIKAAINYGNDLWEEAGLLGAPRKESLYLKASLDEKSTASVYLREEGKYLPIQNARDIHYYDEREKYPSDEAFANFRAIHMGKIAEGVLYRSASPCDDQHNRATYVDRLIEEAGVNGILDLADNDAKIEGYISRDDFNCPYFLSLYNDGKVFPIALNMNYLSEEFAVKIADGLREFSKIEGPYLIHCTEGKDRTGFVCMLIEALAGASYEEIVDDYMLTYDNYYEINETKDPERYVVIKEKNIEAMLQFLVGEKEDYTTADLSLYARLYLMDAGMSYQEVDAFLVRITK